MADTVTSTALKTGNNRYVLRLTNVCDGTGESAVQKVDKSAMTITGQSPAVAVGHMAIDRVLGFVSGFTKVQLLWDHTTDDVAITLAPGNVDISYKDFGGIHDPQSAGGTGDLLLTTSGDVAGDLYDITLDIRFYK